MLLLPEIRRRLRDSIHEAMLTWKQSKLRNARQRTTMHRSNPWEHRHHGLHGNHSHSAAAPLIMGMRLGLDGEHGLAGSHGTGRSHPTRGLHSDRRLSWMKNLTELRAGASQGGPELERP